MMKTNNPTPNEWASEISRMTCIRLEKVRDWMESHGIKDLEGLRAELGDLYPGPEMARAATWAILGW